MMFIIIVTGILSTFDLISGYKLLLVFPYPSRSHSILGQGYVTHLIKAGHEVTYITPYPIKNPPANLQQIDVSKNLEFTGKIASEYTIENIINEAAEIPSITKILELLVVTTNDTVTSKYVQKMLQDPKVNFDAVVIEWLYSEIYAGFAAVFDCPFIWSSSMEPHSLILSLIDETPNPAYSPEHISDSQPPFNFFQRTKELMILLAIKTNKLSTVSRDEEIYKNAFEYAVQKRGRILPPLQEIKYNASLVLGNSHVSSGLAIHLPQNYKPIGGYHISHDVKPLPQDLQILMDNATNGVIYFSLGTIIQSKTLPMDLKKDLMKTFGELKHIVIIWKFEELLPGLPSNVHIVQWAPQQSILAHPNCVLFITHGGLLSITESIHFGVPVIGIPLFADQFINVKRVISKGFGMGVNIDYDMPKNLKVALNEMLENSRYREKAKELSIVYHDRPLHPGAELVHWIEHVVRTRGAPHLRSPALMVPWYQKLYLDLAALIILIILLIVKSILYLLTLLCKDKHYDLNKKNR